MKLTKQNGTLKNLLYIIAGLAGINFIIFIHEMGHFLFAKLFNIPTPYFSLGFGPTLYAFTIKQTTFKIALLPLGGYVEMDPEALNTLPYFPKMLIIFAGILFNLIFAYIILLYYALRKQIITVPTSNTTAPHNVLMGPIGIISMIGKSLAINPRLYWFMLAIISLNIGLFNILPLPFFDGGKALIITIEALTGKKIPATILWFISTIFLALFMLLIMRVTIHDIKRLLKK